MRMPDIKDEDYLNFLTGDFYRSRYYKWKERMLSILDSLLRDLEVMTPEDAIEKYRLLPKDIALLVRLNYVSPEDAERLDLVRIEKSLPCN